MIAIAVVASLVVYAWVAGYIGFQTGNAGKAIAIPSFAVADDGRMVVYVQNVGQGTTEVGAVYINGEQKTFTTSNPVLGEGDTTELTVEGQYNKDTRYDLKVTTTDGTSMTATGKPGSGGTVTVIPAITLNPPSGLSGTTVTVSGTNFAATSAITIRFNGAVVTTAPTSVTTSASGAFSCTFNVPTSANGAYAVSATDSSSGTDSETFTVSAAPAITLNPATGSSGTTVTVSGTNFAATSAITIRFNSEIVTTTPSSVTTSAAGAFSCTFNVPTIANEDYVVSATDASSGTDSETFTVTSGVAEKLAFTVHPSPIAAGVNTLFTIERQTASGNPTTNGGAITINLDDGGVNFANFYAHKGDTTAIFSITLPADSSSVNVYYGYWTGNPLPATLTFTATSTGLTEATTTVQVRSPTVDPKSPTADSGGAWTDEYRAYSDGSGRATSGSGGDTCTYSGYGFTIASSASIAQVRVRLDAYVSSPGNDDLLLEVSADGGSTWLSSTYTYNLPNSDANNFYVDVTEWTTWTTSNINSNMIQAKVTHVLSGGADTINLDWIPIEVTYIP